MRVKIRSMTPTLVFVLLVAFVATTLGSDDTFFILDSPGARCFQVKINVEN